MVKQSAVHPYHDIKSAMKRKMLLIHAATWMDLRDIMLSEKKKKPASDGYIMADSMYITFLK